MTINVKLNSSFSTNTFKNLQNNKTFFYLISRFNLPISLSDIRDHVENLKNKNWRNHLKFDEKSRDFIFVLHCIVGIISICMNYIILLPNNDMSVDTYGYESLLISLE